MNAAAAAACVLELGIRETVVREGLLDVHRVPGRMEGIPTGRGFRIVVDYAHTPDALGNVLQAVKEFTPRKTVVVFGCGGDRDRGKRPRMGAIAAALADRVVVTSDNPRSEDPESICRDILEGTRGFSNVEVEPDRERAIRMAIRSAGDGDTVVLAGKGHETYQEIDGQRIPFDDRRVAESCLNRFEKG
jgi:UDP-N-acetylmuramoyl-L-alanyl-D-glutamate--2,6-diaminopimelate ligase